jgi:hypothetical protein
VIFGVLKYCLKLDPANSRSPRNQIVSEAEEEKRRKGFFRHENQFAGGCQRLRIEIAFTTQIYICQTIFFGQERERRELGAK